MAPALVETATPDISKLSLKQHAIQNGHNKEGFIGSPLEFNKDGELKGTEYQPAASFPKYLPVWDNETAKYPPLTPFEHYDHGKDADPSFPDLLPNGKAKTMAMTPTIGTEVNGVQLSQLTKEGKDQLALFVAQRKVVAFKDQDFAHLPIEKALEIGGYFGRHHIHPASGAPKGFPEIHLVHRGADDKTGAAFMETRTNSIAWHSDVTYEKQPPGTTFLYVLDGPESGGDTLFSNQVKP